MTLHFRCSAEGWQHLLSADWGPCRRFIEVQADQWASRQVDVYENGQILKYSRAHKRDAYGMHIGLRFSMKKKWSGHFQDAELLTPAEFDREWSKAVATVEQR